MAKFTWGSVLERLTIDFDDGQIIEVTKFHPWVRDIGGSINIGVADATVTLYHVEWLSESFNSMESAILACIIRKQLGANQYALHAGLCRALRLKA